MNMRRKRLLRFCWRGSFRYSKLLNCFCPPSFLFCFVPYFDGPRGNISGGRYSLIGCLVHNSKVQVQDTPESQVPSSRFSVYELWRYFTVVIILNPLSFFLLSSRGAQVLWSSAEYNDTVHRPSEVGNPKSRSRQEN